MQDTKNPSEFEFIEALRQSLKWCEEADDCGTVDFEMARWQEWVNSWKPILDKNGGI